MLIDRAFIRRGCFAFVAALASTASYADNFFTDDTWAWKYARETKSVEVGGGSIESLMLRITCARPGVARVSFRYPDQSLNGKPKPVIALYTKKNPELVLKGETLPAGVDNDGIGHNIAVQMPFDSAAMNLFRNEPFVSVFSPSSPKTGYIVYRKTAKRELDRLQSECR